MMVGRKDDRPVVLDDVKQHPAIAVYLEKANEYLGRLGYTEHGQRHVSLVANIGRNVLERLGYPQRLGQLAEPVTVMIWATSSGAPIMERLELCWLLRSSWNWAWAPKRSRRSLALSGTMRKRWVNRSAKLPRP